MRRLNGLSGFVADGLQRFLRSPQFRQKQAAIAAQVRAEHALELSSTSDYWKRLALQDRIDREIKHRIEAITPSPHSLWSCR